MPSHTSASPGKQKRTAAKPRPAKAANKPIKAPTAARVRAKKSKNTGSVAPNERIRLIAEAAYFRAQRRDFEPGHDLADWLEAEAEVDSLLNTRGAA